MLSAITNRLNAPIVADVNVTELMMVVKCRSFDLLNHNFKSFFQEFFLFLQLNDTDGPDQDVSIKKKHYEKLSQ